jgi:hypothetical protein
MNNTGRATVTTAGTPVVLGAGIPNCPVAIKALSTNTGIVYVCYPGGDNTSGYPLTKDNELILWHVGNLASVWIDSASDGDKVAWSLLNW